MKVGYIRVSRNDQNPLLQKDALLKSGCDKIFQEKISGAAKNRAEFDKMCEFVRTGDTVVVWKLDRLGRTVKQLVNLIADWKENDIQLESVMDKIDTNTAFGKFFFHIMAALAELERDMISERTKAGLTAARARGRTGGRPKGLDEKAQKKAKLVGILYEERKMSVSEICEDLGVSRTTIYNYLKHEKFEKCPRSGTYLRKKPKFCLDDK